MFNMSINVPFLGEFSSLQMVYYHTNRTIVYKMVSKILPWVRLTLSEHQFIIMIKRPESTDISAEWPRKLIREPVQSAINLFVYLDAT